MPTRTKQPLQLTDSVARVMSTPAVAVPADLTADKVLSVMVRLGLRHIVVVDPDGRCTGVINDRAIVALWATSPTAFGSTPADRLLDPRPCVVGVDARIHDAARVMYLDATDAVAVIDRTGTAVGVITGADIVHLIATAADVLPEPATRISPAE